MSKAKLFIENFLVYGLGGIISKIIPLVMLPVVTRLMPDSFYFGLSDLSNTLVQFASALAVMGMYDACFRLFFDKEDTDFQKVVCSTGLLFTLVTSFIIFIFLIIARRAMAAFVFSSTEYSNLIYLSALSVFIGATNSIMQIPTRTQNKRRIYLVMNTIGPVISYAVSIPMLMAGYYEIALPMAGVISAVTLEVGFYTLNRSWFSIRAFDLSILKELLIIAVPLLPNFLIYWIFNSSDRLMIGKLIGNAATGIYGVGARIGSAAQLIYTAFAGGWQYFAFSTMKDENQVENNSRVFEYLGVVSFCCSMLVFALAHLVFTVLFTGVYVDGYIVAPYLFLAPLMQMLFQVACNQFIVIKKTWPNIFILSAGALFNVGFNFIMIPLIGIEGAAIATLLGYILSDIICCVVLTSMKLMIISKRFLVCCFLMSSFIVGWRLVFMRSTVISLICALVFIGLMIWIYRADLALLLNRKHV